MTGDEECDCPLAKILKLLFRGNVKKALSDEEFYEIIRKVLGLDDDILREKPKRKKI